MDAAPTPDALSTTIFTLSRADALAYERARFRWGWAGGLLATLVTCLAGAGVVLIPADWTGPPTTLRFGLLVAIFMTMGLVLVMIAVALAQWWRARSALPKRHEVRLVEWDDRLEWQARGETRIVPLQGLVALPTRTHLFLSGTGAPLILPLRAFADLDRLDALVLRTRPPAAPAAAAPTEEENPLAAAIAVLEAQAQGPAPEAAALLVGPPAPAAAAMDAPLPPSREEVDKAALAAVAVAIDLPPPKA